MDIFGDLGFGRTDFLTSSPLNPVPNDDSAGPPPPGYAYWITDTGPVVDNNLNPVLIPT